MSRSRPVKSPSAGFVFRALAAAVAIGAVVVVHAQLERGSGGGVGLVLTLGSALATLLWRQGLRVTAPFAESVLAGSSAWLVREAPRWRRRPRPNVK